MRTVIRTCSVAIILFAFVVQGFGQNDPSEEIARLLHRDSATILITDSGLGGLSVGADLERLLTKARTIRSVRLVFVNALPDLAHTYNSMANVKEQASAFDDMLSGTIAAFHPDVVLIACNTLSAVYPKTSFAQRPPVPVVSIIEVGAEMIARQAKISGNSRVLILGTPSTITSGVYVDKLSQRGIARERIFSQPCKLLESEIQTDPNSDLVSSLVETYVDEALESQVFKGLFQVSVGLCCSHYGYCAGAFRTALTSKLGKRFVILNPNEAMVALFDAPGNAQRVKRTTTTVEVCSRVPFTDQEIASIAGAVGKTSKKTADALRNYRLKPDLFPFHQ